MADILAEVKAALATVKERDRRIVDGNIPLEKIIPWLRSLVERCEQAEGEVQELKKTAHEDCIAKMKAEGNLASICDVVNSWAREENYTENTDYLGFMTIRDHINDLWGLVNKKRFARFDQYEDKINAALAVLREVYDRLTRTDTDGLGWDKDNPLPRKIAAAMGREK